MKFEVDNNFMLVELCSFWQKLFFEKSNILLEVLQNFQNEFKIFERETIIIKRIKNNNNYERGMFRY